MTREIVLDTETTGLNPKDDRVVEIGCVELVNHVPTGRHFHVYLNPQRPMAADAFEVHGLSDQFLSTQPRFADKADEFLAFIKDSPLIAHNANFDIDFLDEELRRINLPGIRSKNQIIDTVAIARERNPGARASLDALCKQFGIDNSRRTLHGALLDSEILAEVYLELIGGRQVTMALISETRLPFAETTTGYPVAKPREIPLTPRITAIEIEAHVALVATLGKESLWAYYLDEKVAA